MGYDVCVYTSYGHVRFLAMAFVDVLSQNCTEIVGKSYGNRRVSIHFKVETVQNPYGVREESLRFLTEHLRSRYDRDTIFVPKLS